MDAFKALSLRPPPEWVREKEWTPEQQVQEYQRREMVLLEILYSIPEFSPRPSDVIVATAPKTGTTWLSHICHQIRMAGVEPEFEVQNDVITALVFNKVFNYDPNTRLQPAEPRIFVTHQPYSKVPKGGKMITCMREMSDTLLSKYRFFDSLLSLKGRVALPIFCNESVKNESKQRLCTLIEWWEHRHDQNVLFLFFEDLKEDHTGCVRRIAKFMGVDCSEEVISRVVHTTTHAEMVKHHGKFGGSHPNAMTEMLAKMFGDDPPAHSVGRVRKGGGNYGEGAKVLPDEVLQQLQKDWEEVVTPKLGFKNYAEMRQAWKREYMWNGLK